MKFADSHIKHPESSLTVTVETALKISITCVLSRNGIVYTQMSVFVPGQHESYETR